MIYRYSDYLKNKYGEKVYKLPIQLPVTCPNRIYGQGCTFCAEVGTGFEAMSGDVSVTEQLSRTRELISRKYKARKYIAYFQNYTNTFLKPSLFERYINEAAEFPDIVEISVSTRPDCIAKEHLDILKTIQEQYGIQITVELGLQTANYHVLDKICRGHGLAEYIDAVLLLRSYGFTICTHIIGNLPWDTKRDMIETSKIVSSLGTNIVKVHSLYIAKNTRMEVQYKNNEFTICSKEEYYERLRVFLEHLSPDIAVERLFSRIPEEDSVFSNWGTSWWKLQDEFTAYMSERGSEQGLCYQPICRSALRYLDTDRSDFDESKDD